MMKYRFAFMAALLLSSVIPALVPFADATSTWYVAPPPASTTGGSCATPDFNTISAAVAAATTLPGDTIIVCAGIYHESISIMKALTITGMDGAIVQPKTKVEWAIFAMAHDVTIQGLEVDGSQAPVYYGIFYYNARDGVVKHNTVHDISNTLLADYKGVGILFWGDDGKGMDNELIQGNTVYNTGRMGIFVGGVVKEWPYVLSSNVVIAKNNVYRTWQGPTKDDGAGIQINGGKNFIVEGNNVHHTGQPQADPWLYAGIYLAGTVNGLVTRNNVHQNPYGVVIWWNADWVVYGSDAPSKPTLDRNNIHNNVVDNLVIITWP